MESIHPVHPMEGPVPLGDVSALIDEQIAYEACGGGSPTPPELPSVVIPPGFPLPVVFGNAPEDLPD